MGGEYPLDFGEATRKTRGAMHQTHGVVPIRILTVGLVAGLLSLAGLARGEEPAHAAFARIRPAVERSVVMVKLAAFPQVRVRGVIQPPRQFDLEGPATVVAPGVIASSLTIFDPVKTLPPREGVEFSATVYTRVQILVEGGAWIEASVSATSEPDDLIFFAPAEAAASAGLPALASIADPTVTVFSEYMDVTRAPAAFEHCAIARLSAITGRAPSGAYLFVTSQSAGSPVVDANGAMLGLGVRVGGSGGMPPTSVLLPAARVLAVAREKGLPAPVSP